MKFQWYIIDLDDGSVKGSNDVDVVRPFITNDQYVVLTAQHGQYYAGADTPHEVHDIADEDSDDEEDDDDDEESPEDKENESEESDDDEVEHRIDTPKPSRSSLAGEDYVDDGSLKPEDRW